MVVGMARLTGTETKTAEDSEDAETLGSSLLLEALNLENDSFGLPLPFSAVRASFRPRPEVFALLIFASSASSAVLVCFFFLSIRAHASASHAAFNRPCPAGRLLVHSRDRASPAISSMLRLLSTDSSMS